MNDPRPILNRIEELSILKKGWGHGGVYGWPISVIEEAQTVVRKLPVATKVPIITPLSNGGIQLGWQNKEGFEFNLDIMPGGMLQFECRKNLHEVMFEGRVPLECQGVVNDLYTWFAERFITADKPE